MYTLEQLAKKLPVRIVEKANAQIHPSVLAAQLNINGWLDEDLIDMVLRDARECIITVFATDYGPEARISGQVGKYPEERTELPGFTAARNMVEVTIEKELERAAEYIGRKYAPRLGALRNKPATYVLEKVIPNEPAKHAIVSVSSELAPVDTEQEYWHFTAHGMLSKDQGRAVMRLAEASHHHKLSGNHAHTDEEAWARTMTRYSIYSLLEMLKQHGRKNVAVKQYRADDGIYAMDDLEYGVFADPEIRKSILMGIRTVTVPLSYIKKADSSSAQPLAPNPPQ